MQGDSPKPKLEQHNTNISAENKFDRKNSSQKVTGTNRSEASLVDDDLFRSSSYSDWDKLKVGTPIGLLLASAPREEFNAPISVSETKAHLH